MEGECAVHRLVADVAIRSSDRVLFVKYKDVSRYDGQRGWFLPDDFLRHLEHPEDAAKRIAQDQSGLTLTDVRLSHIESFGDGAWHLIFHYRADLTNSPRLQPGPNVVALEWFPRSQLPDRSTMAHGGWAVDILDAMDRARTAEH
jgi:ADP-ribose pyrophosphatase YjhB (NUDIX family)